MGDVNGLAAELEALKEREREISRKIMIGEAQSSLMRGFEAVSDSPSTAELVLETVSLLGQIKAGGDGNIGEIEARFAKLEKIRDEINKGVDQAKQSWSEWRG